MNIQVYIVEVILLLLYQLNVYKKVARIVSTQCFNSVF